MPVTPLEPNDPQRLGDFVLAGRLGAGGMGVVYLGHDPHGTPVAVKLVRSDLAHDPTFRERFRREVEAQRRIHGPRVAQLVAADTEAVQPFLVVEYVEGPTLADSVAANGPLGGTRLQALAAALAEAIVMIHEVGVIHRDLKPSNVILAADQPKLVDFGIASAAGSLPLTLAGTVIGSAGWMAPEQAAGAVSTPAVDVFTWASLVAFAGTGRPPFGVGSVEEVTSRILHGDPDLEGLPRGVRPLVEAAFIKDPTQRPSARAVLSGLVGGGDEASTDELVEETTHLIENTWVMPAGGWPVLADRTPVRPPPPPPVAALPQSPSPPAPPPARRRSLWPVVVAVGVVCLLAGIAIATVLGGGDGNEDAGPSPTTPGAPATVPPVTVAPTTTAAPTTTTTVPPVDMTVLLTLSQDDLGDFFDQLVGIDPGCPDPGALVGIEQINSTVLVEPTPFGEGERITGGFVDDCDYTLDLPQVARNDRYVIRLSDSEGEYPPATLTQDDLALTEGLVDLNELFDISQFVPAG